MIDAPAQDAAAAPASARGPWLCLLAFVCGCAFWRWSYIPLLSDEPLPGAAVAAAVFDGLWLDLVLGAMTVLAFVLSAHIRPGGLAVRMLVSVLVLFATFLRVADYLYYRDAGDRLNPGGFVSMPFDGHAHLWMWTSLGVALAWVVALFLVNRTRRRAVPVLLGAVVLAVAIAITQTLARQVKVADTMKFMFENMPGAPEIDIFFPPS